MNRKRKLNDLYKGVFKNDKKSCIVDLKPLDKKRELDKLNHKESEEDLSNLHPSRAKVPIEQKSKPLNVNLKVSKNLNFGSFFKRLREEIVDVFMAKDDLISFEGLVNSQQINELFNGNFNRESKSKNFIDLEKVSLERGSKKNMGSVIYGGEENTNLILANDRTGVKDHLAIEEDDEEEEILYEDEMETIYKRRKPPSRKINHLSQLNHFNIRSMNNNFNEEENQSDQEKNFYYERNLPQRNELLHMSENTSNLFDISNMLSFTKQAKVPEVNFTERREIHQNDFTHRNHTMNLNQNLNQSNSNVSEIFRMPQQNKNCQIYNTAANNNFSQKIHNYPNSITNPHLSENNISNISNISNLCNIGGNTNFSTMKSGLPEGALMNQRNDIKEPKKISRNYMHDLENSENVNFLNTGENINEKRHYFMRRSNKNYNQPY
jgi:hypothetical protein